MFVSQHLPLEKLKQFGSVKEFPLFLDKHVYEQDETGFSFNAKGKRFFQHPRPL
jgi:hypothetical protein